MIIIDENDLGKSREELLMDMIYETNRVRVPLDKILFGIPKEVDQRKDLDNDPNTFVPVRINPEFDDRFNLGNSGVMYRRHSIIDYLSDADLESITPLFLPFKISDILEQINALVSYPFQIEELINYEYKTLEEVNAGIKITAAPGAYLWFGSVTTLINTSKISGAPLITNTNLLGFNIYQPA